MRLIVRPRLRSVLLLITLLALAAPVGGLWLMRLYESALIRQTEQELFAQAAVLAAVFRAELRHGRGEAPQSPTYGPGPSIGPLGLALARRAGLDLARDQVLPPPPEPTPAEAPDPADARAGAALSALLGEAQGVTLAALRIVDAHGVIVSTTGGDLGRSVLAWPEVAGALRGELTSTMRRRERPARASGDDSARDERLRVFVAFPVLEGEHAIAAVLVSRTPRTLGEAMWDKRYALAGIAGLLLGAAALLAVAASRLIARPMRHVVLQAQRVARGETDAVVPPRHPGTREMADLVDAIARMATTQAERAAYLRSFAASVSHEFKTPLAAMGGAAELLADHYATMSEAERAGFFAAIGAGVVRLNLLVRRMLDLARADLSPAGGEVDAMAVVPRVAQRFSAAGLRVAVVPAPLRLAVAAGALEMMLTGLLDNVVAHAGPHARVEIVLAPGAPMATITVTDDGPGVSPENAVRVFETFFTTARDRGGTGLGLAIVAAVARGAHGTVTLLDRSPGAAFRLTLPAA